MSALLPHYKFAAVALGGVLVLSLMTKSSTPAAPVRSASSAACLQPEDLMAKIQLYLAASNDTQDAVGALSHVQFALAYFKLLPEKTATVGSVSLRDVQTQIETRQAQLLARLAPHGTHGSRAPYA
jgi:hypothetical protein